MAGVDESSASVDGDNDIFIGRHLSSSSTSWLPGSIEVPRRSANFGIMRVFNSKGNMSEANNGDILVEVEPTRYQLEIHSSLPEDEPQRTKKVLRSDVVLAKSSLFRFEEGKDSEKKVEEKDEPDERQGWFSIHQEEGHSLSTDGQPHQCPLCGQLQRRTPG